MARNDIINVDGSINWNTIGNMFDDDEKRRVDVSKFSMNQQGIMAAVTYAKTKGYSNIYLPAGNYLITAPALFNDLQNMNFEGDGASTHIVMSANTDLFSFQGQTTNVKLRNMWIGAFEIKTLGIGINIQGTSAVHADTILIENVILQNIPSPIYIQYLDRSNFINMTYVQSIANATVGNIFILRSSPSIRIKDFRCFSTAGNIANVGLDLDYDTDTIIVENAEILNCLRGIICHKSGGSTGPRLIRLIDCYCESCTSSGFDISDGRDVRLIGCHSAVNSGSGFNLTGGTSINLTDCIALQNSLHGFYITGGIKVKVNGCTASNNSQATSVTYDGMRIETGVNNVRVINNVFGDFIFTTTNKQRYGLSIDGTTDYLIIIGNEFLGNQTGTLANFSTGTHNQVVNNITA